jgi:hypothetical protein
MGWSRWSHEMGRGALLLAALALGAGTAWCQSVATGANEPAAELAQSVRDLEAQVKELRNAVSELRSEAAQYHAETLELRRELETARTQGPHETGVASVGEASVSEAQGRATGYLPSEPADANRPGPPTDKHPMTMAERLQLLTAKVDDQYQSKVESASKYHVRLNGLLLLNLFSNRGYMDNADSPHLVEERAPDQARGNFGGTLRQSIFGLEVTGPEWLGAKTTGNVQVDFAGGFPNTLNGVSFGLVRMRTATFRMDWQNTSVVGGQDVLFFSPQTPSSLASLAEPALSYAGNLWSWTPQLRVEHRVRLSENSSISLQGGILDPLTGEPPLQQFYRSPQAGEASNAPGVGSRVAWTTQFFGQPLTLGVGGYYSRENWGFDRTVDGWAGTSDWSLPLGHFFTVTGEFYRGRAIGGLGGGIGRSVLFNGTLNVPTTIVHGLDDMGGWSQLKFKPTSTLEFNAAYGQDSSFANEVRAASASTSYFDPKQSANRSAFVNFIYHPRSALLFSLEYRRLRTITIGDPFNSGNHVNLGMGILF